MSANTANANSISSLAERIATIARLKNATCNVGGAILGIEVQVVIRPSQPWWPVGKILVLCHIGFVVECVARIRLTAVTSIVKRKIVVAAEAMRTMMLVIAISS